jgi:cytochrome c2
MNQRMQMMSGRNMMGMMHDIKAPEDRELEVLIAYLEKYAQKPIDRSQYEDLNSTAGKTFSTICSQCHALPDPKQHTDDEWPAVVQRMVQNMKLMGKSVPDEETVETVLGFLQKHTR